jgi:uncharacterized protein (TIGR03435 family)
MTRIRALAIGSILGASISVYGQAAPGGALPTFEVASIKRNTSGEPNGSFGVRPGGVLVVVNNSLRNIVRNAYSVQNFQIVGGPDWFDTDRFDITAKAAADAPPDQLLLMMRDLLADRFRLRARKEARDTPVYALMLARADKRLGPKLRSSAVDCQAQVAAAIAAARGGGASAAPAVGTPRCGTRSVPGTMTGVGVSMSDLARNLSPPAGRVIVDRTGLTGAWDLELAYALERSAPDTPVAADTPSLFTALQEQLGLKLEAETAPLDMLVIDSAERPAGD